MNHIRSTAIASVLLCLCLGRVEAQTAPTNPPPPKRVAAQQLGAEAKAKSAPQPTQSPPIRIVRPAELREKSLSGEYEFYLGSPHAHSGYSGDHAKMLAEKFNQGVANYDLHTPREVFEKAKTNFYDFYFMTDHSSPEQNAFYRGGFTEAHWAATKQQADATTTARFVALHGYEFSRNTDPENGGLGHMNVLNSRDWNSAYAPGHTFEWLYDWLVPQTGALVVAQFNHPQMPGGAKAKNFKNYAGRTKARNEAVRLVEIWNTSEGMGYVATVQKIWALGWKVAPTAGSDVHGLFGIENKRLRTGVLAERLTADAIMRALQARRVYATLEPLLHLEFMLNGIEMGTTVERRPAGELKAKVFVNDPGGSVISRVEIRGGKYETNGGGNERVAVLPVGAGKKLAEATVPGGYDFYYAVVFKEGVETARAFSSPIWMDNE
jgi:hypothetical protein